MEEVLTFSPIVDLAVEMLTEDGRYVYLVSSQSLRVVSPVWLKILDPETKFRSLDKTTANGKEYPKTSIEGAEHQSVTILFNVIHHKHRDVPRLVDFDTLHGLTLLVDQFDCATVLGLWPQTWIPPLVTETSHPNAEFQSWLFIGTIFPDIPECSIAVRDISARLIKQMIFTNKEENEIGGCFQKLDDGNLLELDISLVPNKIIDYMVAVREHRIRKILTKVQAMAQGMMDTSLNDPGKWGDAFCAHPDCFALAAGSLALSIKRQKLHSLLHGETSKVAEYSLEEVVGMVGGLRISTFLFKTSTTEGISWPDHTTDQELDYYPLKQLLRPSTRRVFLRNQRDYKEYDGTESLPCPLAVKLAKIQSEAEQLLEDVKGYEVSPLP